MALVVVRHYHTLHLAQIACEMLRAEDIRAVVMDENGTATFGVGVNAFVSSYRLWVPEPDLEAAERLLSEIALEEIPEASEEGDFDDSYRWDDVEAEDEALADHDFRPTKAARIVAGLVFGLLGAGILAAMLMMGANGAAPLP